MNGGHHAAAFAAAVQYKGVEPSIAHIAGAWRAAAVSARAASVSAPAGKPVARQPHPLLLWWFVSTPFAAGPAAAAEGLPLADFHYDTSAEIEAAGAATGTASAAAPREIEAAAIGVRVTNPTSFGSGLAKHTRYNVVTSTTLTQHFPHREMGVWR